MTHDVIIDGKEYVLNTQAEHKEGDPIYFPITKKDMEHHMNTLDEAILKFSVTTFKEQDIYRSLIRTKNEFQRMIDEAEKRGNWK